MAARADLERRENRAALEGAQRAVQMAIEDALRPLEQIHEMTRLLVSARLLCDGFHRNDRGPWRKRRGRAYRNSDASVYQ